MRGALPFRLTLSLSKGEAALRDQPIACFDRLSMRLEAYAFATPLSRS